MKSKCSIFWLLIGLFSIGLARNTEDENSKDLFIIGRKFIYINKKIYHYYYFILPSLYNFTCFMGLRGFIEKIRYIGNNNTRKYFTWNE
jgi:hypothetical protein